MKLEKLEKSYKEPPKRTGTRRRHQVSVTQICIWKIIGPLLSFYINIYAKGLAPRKLNNNNNNNNNNVSENETKRPKTVEVPIY